MKEEVYEKIKDDLPEKLRKDVEKYGLENFEFEILDTASTQEELNRKQKEYIKKYNSLEPHGYNLPEENSLNFFLYLLLNTISLAVSIKSSYPYKVFLARPDSFKRELIVISLLLTTRELKALFNRIL